MAFSSSPTPPLLLLILLIASAANAATNSFESEDMLQSLRNYGYTLFTNGISTSDLKYQLLSDSAAEPSKNYTLFAPRDELLYALDMAADAVSYVSTLRYHIIPNRRHTFADLKNLSVPFLDTLLPHYAVLIGRVRDVDASSDRPSIAIVVDGVRVTFPDLFVGSRIAVHGIDGILLTGLNMSRDLLDGNGHPPPAGSPPPVKNNVSAPAPAPTKNNVSAPAPAPKKNNVSAPAPSPTKNNVSTPAPSPTKNNVSAPAPSPTKNNVSAPAPAPTKNNISAPAPAPGALNVSVAPAPNTPPGTANHNVSTPVPSNVNKNVPAKGSSTSRESHIDRDNVAAGPAAGGDVSTKTDRSNISSDAAPRISQDQIEIIKGLSGKRGHRKGRRRRRHQHGSRRALSDL